jgi:predicted RNA-binding protein associated with RNAse of E/G family
MLNNLFRVNEGKSILIAIPNQKEKLSISLVDSVVDKGLTIINVKVNNKHSFRELTNTILKYYIDIEMKTHLKFYSIENIDDIYFEIL